MVPSNGAFYSRCLEVGSRILSFENPVIAHHYDADGLSSGSIVCRAFRLARKPYEEITFRKLDGEALDRLAVTGRQIIFVDFGSGQSKKILEKIPAGKFAIIDHHELDSPSDERRNLTEANCELFGLSGSTEACAASTAYLCFRDMRDYVMQELAVVGVVGDMQDKAELSQTNSQVIQDGVSDGSVIIEKDLRMFGRVSRSLVGFLSFCTEPFLPGLTGNDKACALFLHDLGITLFKDEAPPDWKPPETDGGEPEQVRRRWLHYYDLDAEQRRTLSTALITYCYGHRVKEHAIKRMVGDVYLFPNEPLNTELYDAYEHSTVLNACGRHGQEKLGVSVCLREKGAIEQARSLVTLHRTMIRQALAFARRHVSNFGAFYFLDGRGIIEDSVVGIVCGAYLTGGQVEPDKPIIGFALDPSGDIKVSGRGTDDLVKKGLDLNEVMRKATDGIGYGGGHKIASGAAILKEHAKEGGRQFLLKAKEIIRTQLSWL